MSSLRICTYNIAGNTADMQSAIMYANSKGQNLQFDERNYNTLLSSKLKSLVDQGADVFCFQETAKQENNLNSILSDYTLISNTLDESIYVKNNIPAERIHDTAVKITVAGKDILINNAHIEHGDSTTLDAILCNMHETEKYSFVVFAGDFNADRRMDEEDSNWQFQKVGADLSNIIKDEFLKAVDKLQLEVAQKIKSLKMIGFVEPKVSFTNVNPWTGTKAQVDHVMVQAKREWYHKIASWILSFIGYKLKLDIKVLNKPIEGICATWAEKDKKSYGDGMRFDPTQSCSDHGALLVEIPLNGESIVKKKKKEPN